jgi:UDP-2,3-diacylglucosamine pyrophosphatase LpxH
MTKFQIVSDLHIEYESNDVPDPLTLITPSADILILAGDIGSFYKYDQLKTFLVKLCFHFRVVIYVPGNHEYYTMKGYTPQRMNTLFQNFAHIEQSIDNLYILNRSSAQIDDVCIVGCTLWSDPKIQIPSYMVRIPGLNTIVYQQKHAGDLAYIKKMIKYCQKKEVKLLVVTHHCPTYSVITSKKKLNDRYVSLYATDLDDLLNKEMVHTWVAGHIHSNFDLITEGGTRLVGNQKGKPRDRITDYNKSLVITV